mgnify:CR=1 FL=1
MASKGVESKNRTLRTARSSACELLSEVLRMDVMNLVKRFVPFVAALAVGIFITSFFVDIRGPRLFRMDMNGRGHCRHKMRDYDRLQRENYMLRRQLEEDRFSMPQQSELPVPPPRVRAAPVGPPFGGLDESVTTPDNATRPHHPKK